MINTARASGSEEGRRSLNGRKGTLNGRKGKAEEEGRIGEWGSATLEFRLKSCTGIYVSKLT